MRSETIAWLVVGIAGTCSGVIAGLRVSPGSILAITAVVAAAAGVVTWILPQHADPVR